MDGSRARAAVCELIERGIVYIDTPADCVRVAHAAKASGLLPLVSGMCEPEREGLPVRYYVRYLAPFAGTRELWAFQHRGTLYIATDEEELRQRADELIGMGRSIILEELTTLEVEGRRGALRVELVAERRRN